MNLNKKAFTLIELLVVIGIVIILAGLLLPSLIKAKNQSKAVKCLANLKQISLAMTLYIHDSGFFPTLATMPTFEFGQGKKWYYDIKPYTSSKWDDGINICPSYNGPILDGGFKPFLFTVSVGSYAYNIGNSDSFGIYRYGLGGNFSDGAIFVGKPTRETEVVNPSDMIVNADSFFRYQNSEIIIEWFEMLTRRFHFYPELTNIIKYQKGPKIRHDGKINTSFVDGHVEKIKYENLFLSESPTNLKKWHIDNQPHQEIFR